MSLLILVLYLSLGLGGIYSQMRRKQYKKWMKLKWWEQGVAVLLAPLVQIYAGYMALSLLLAATVLNGELGFNPPDDEDEED